MNRQSAVFLNKHLSAPSDDVLNHKKAVTQRFDEEVQCMQGAPYKSVGDLFYFKPRREG